MPGTLSLERPQAGAVPAPPPPRWRGYGVHAAVLLGYVALGVLVMGRFVTDPAGRVSGHLPVDHTWFEWLLSHGAYSVRHLENPLFSTRQNTPDGVNLMANTSVLGVTLPLAPLTLLVGPRVMYVVWMIGACAGTAATAYWMLRRHLVRSRGAAALPGAFAGFAPGIVHHANGQPNFVSNFLLPVIVARALLLGAHGRWARDGLILAALVTYQIFLNEELLLITALACGVAATVGGHFRRPDFRRALAVTAGAAAVLCAYPIWFQFAGPQSFRGVPMFTEWGEDPATYLTFARDTLAGDASAEAFVGGIEQNSWFGPPLVLLAVVLAVVTWRRARSAAVVAVVFAVLSLGPVIRFAGQVTGQAGPLSVLPDGIPVLDMLMPSRLTYAVIGAITVLLAVGAEAPRWRVVVAAALVPLIPTPVPAVPEPRPPVFITSGAWRPYVPADRTLVPLPLPSNWLGRDTLGWSSWTRHEFAVPEGYFLGPGPDGAGQMGPARISTTTQLVTSTIRTGVVPEVTPDTRATAWADLRTWRASVVVLRVDPRTETVRRLAERLYGPSRQVMDVWLWDVRGPEFVPSRRGTN